VREQRVGAFEYYDPTGRYVKHVPSHVQNYISSGSQMVTAPLIDTRSRIIADYLTFTAFSDFIANDIDTLKPKKFDFHRIYNPLEPVDLVYKNITTTLRLEYLEQLEQTLTADKTKEEVIKRNYDTFEQTAVFDFDGFLSGLIDIGVDFVLGQVNKLLPPGYQLSVDVDSSGFNGFSIGGIGYNAKENTLTYDGRLFNALLSGGLDLLNDLLPDFLAAELGLNQIRIGSITIDFDDMEEGVEIEILGQVKLVKVLNEIRAIIGGKEIAIASTLATIAGAAASGFINKGLSSLNRSLPDGLKVGVNFKPGSFIPSVSMGPVTLDLQTGSLSLNMPMVTSIIDGALNRYVFSKLPGPLGAIARLAWRSLDLNALFSQIIDDTPPSPEQNITINPGGESALPRLVSSPPIVGNLPMGGYA
jgi:hypothetical protein